SLKVLANQVMVQLETRRQRQSLEALDKERIKINQKLTTQTEHLGKEREFLTALLESLSEGIVACDENGKLSLFNHATRDLHGLEEVKLPPEQWAEHYDLYLADGKTLMSLEQIPLFRAYRGEKIIDEELVIAPKNRPIKKVKCNGQPILSPSGNKLGAVVAMSDVTVQKDKEIALAKSEAKLSAIFNQSYLFQGLTEVNGTVIDINDIALDACGYKRHEEMGKKFWETGWWRHDPKISEYVKKVIEAGQNGEVVHAATDYHTASGECRKTEFVLTPIRDELGKVAYLLLSGQDVTDRKKSESELAIVNRALRLLSLSNELLIRSKSEIELLTNLCEVIVKTGGYEMAWVGYSYNDAEKSIKPVAHFGNLSHLKDIKLSWSEDPPVGKGPAAKTIRGGRPIVVKDIVNDVDFAPWLDSATNSGYRGVICLPLIHNNQVFGLVAMYAKNVIQVVDSEIKLLQELADDLSFGIMNIRAQQEKQRFHAALYKMASSVSASIDQNFFIQLTRNMTEATSADAGFVAKLSLEDNPTLQSIAVLKEGVESDYFSFSIKDEACSALMGKDCFVLSHSSLDCLQHLPLITELGAKNCIGQRLTDSTGQAIGVVAVLLKNPTHDIDFICSLLKIFAARASAELDRLNSDRHIRAQASLLDKAQDAIMVRDLNHKVEFWNNGAERLYGWTREEALGKSIVELLYPETNQFYMAMDKLLKGGEWSGEIEQCSKYGEKLIIESHWTLVYNEQGRPQSIFTINTNITDRKVAADKIQYLAFYDPLTSLPNRTLLLDRLKQALSNCVRSHHFGALLFIDLDNFKSLNDTLGHDKGDLLLNEIGERLKSCVRESDSVARFGGDEFVIMLENISLDEVEAGILTTKIAEKVLNSLNQPYLLEGYQHQSTASIGITLFSDQDSNVNELFKRADVAMYQAKSAGRNALRFFDPKMQLEISAKVLLESDLRQSLSKQQFLLHYQPQLNDLGRV
ncbi:MAG: diguanylate cyclase, partial [Pseudomonadota bacterium]